MSCIYNVNVKYVYLAFVANYTFLLKMSKRMSANIYKEFNLIYQTRSIVDDILSNYNCSFGPCFVFIFIPERMSFLFKEVETSLNIFTYMYLHRNVTCSGRPDSTPVRQRKQTFVFYYSYDRLH